MLLICLFCYEIPCITSYSLSYFNRHVVSYFKSTLFIDVNRIVEFSPNLNFIKSMGSWKLSSFEVKTSFINKFKKYHWKSRNWASTITNWQQFTHLKERIFSAKKAINKRSKRSWSGSNFPPPKHSFLKKRNKLQYNINYLNTYIVLFKCLLLYLL